MAHLDIKQRAYLAGFLDGDGCISVKFEKRASSSRGFVLKPRISFTQHTKNRIVLEKIFSWIGDGSLDDYLSKNISELIIRKKSKIKSVLNQIEPYLIVKKDQAKLMLLMLSLPVFRGKKDDNLFSESYLIAKQIRVLNLTSEKYQDVPLFDPVTTDSAFIKKS